MVYALVGSVGVIWVVVVVVSGGGYVGGWGAGVGSLEGMGGGGGNSQAKDVQGLPPITRLL